MSQSHDGYVRKEQLNACPDFIAHRREKDGKVQSLWDHLLETSRLSAVFAEKIGLRRHGELLALLHDLGKASKEFDQYIRSATGLIDPDEDDYVDAEEQKGKVDHSSAGAQIIYRAFSKKDNGNLAAEILSLVIASHHSGLLDCLTPDGVDNLSRRMNKSDEKTKTTESYGNLIDFLKRKIEEILAEDSIIEQINQKLKSLQEKNDSQETFMFKTGLLVRYLFSCLIDADRINTADFEIPNQAKERNLGAVPDWDALIEKLEQRLRGFTCQNHVDQIRSEVSDKCLRFAKRPKGLYQLTVPTGGGKTLSSLRFALNHAREHGMDRIIYVLPYTSIIDQNADTVRKILEDKTEDGYATNIVLEHHSNLTPEKETSRQKLLAENWDAPVIFTTMVQFLEAIFGAGTRNARRMHQLARAVLIFDEIQTLPVKCVHLFNIAIRFLIQNCGSTVVLCTATQPLLDKVEPASRALQITPGQQMTPDIKRLFEELKRVEVYDRRKPGGWTVEEVAKLAKEELAETKSVLIIVNTKKAAVDLFQKLKNRGKAEVYHLSTNMCPAHRMEVLKSIKECLPDKKSVICVSTQLIEAGVDIDFGSVIRYLAGLDSIAQAAGRCNRNGLRPRLGRVFILNPKEENLGNLQDIKIGRDIAERVLNDFLLNLEEFNGDILGPKAMERYYHYYFYARKEEMCYKVGTNSGVGRADNLFELFSTNKLSVDAYQRVNQSQPSIMLRQSFMSASKEFQVIDSPTRGIIVPYKDGAEIINQLCAAKNLEKQYRLLRNAQRYSVNVYSHLFDRLLREKAIHEVQEGAGVFYLDKRYYTAEYGLSKNPVGEMDILSF
jgi:CRISPR-associated endonuclease/helicase Cas3